MELGRLQTPMGQIAPVQKHGATAGNTRSPNKSIELLESEADEDKENKMFPKMHSKMKNGIRQPELS